jgi:tetratricopeptide (TPR) repeat protein
VLPDFVLTAANADAVATLCRLLEGMPLALEMAAAWVRTLPPARMLEHLEGNVTRLSSRRRDLPARQRSLSATIEWSYELLEPGLRALFSRLSVFRGGWTHESAEQVCGEGVGYRGIEVLGTGSASHIEERATSVSPQHPDTSIPDTQYPDLLDSLTDLVDKSLVIYEDAEPEGRYRMLEPLREFAADRLTESGERPAFVRRHIAFVYNLALEAGRGRQGHSDSGALARLLRETDNLRAALDGCRELEDVELELRLAGSLRVFWSASGLIAEGRRQLQEALMHPGAQEPTVARSLALRTMGYLAQLQNDRTMARSCFEQALEILRARDDQAGVPAVLGHLAWLSREEHRDKEAHSLLTEALAGYRRLGHQEGIAQCLGNLGVLALDRNDTVTARAHLEEAISLCRQQENIYHLAAYLGMLGNLETTEGRLAAASASLEEALVIQRSLQDRSGIACTLLPLGFLRRKQGDEVAAEAHLRECLTLSREMNVPSLILDTLWALAELCQRRHPKIAALLMAAVNAQRAALNLPSEPNGHNDDPLPTGLKSSLEPAEYEAACREGAELTLDQATDLALAL